MYKEGGGGKKCFFRTDPSDVMRQNDGSIWENCLIFKKSKNLAASLSGAQQGYNDHSVGNFRHAPHQDMRSD